MERGNMFGAEAHANKPGWKPAQIWKPLKQLQLPRETEWAGATQNAPNDPVLNCELQPLCCQGREVPPLLDSLKVLERGGPDMQLWAQDVRRRDRVLDGQIDADSTDWRHRVRCITNTDESRTRPLHKTINFHRQKTDLTPIAQFLDAIMQERFHFDDFALKRGQTALPHFRCRVLRDHKRSLPVGLAIDEHEHFARLGVPERSSGIPLSAA